MTRVIIKEDPIAIVKLQEQASRQGRSLQAELKYILKSAILKPSRFAVNIPLVPLEDLRQSVQNSLTESGYDSKEKIIELLQEVKKEIADERDRDGFKFDRFL